ncbi:MAG: DNA polymerase III subunit gamma/tau [Candidatus Moraniibacteriota bacterium]|nr:MAG: DNA polymerase III subunit gamma/tau [Candidatus Moranbacteria bacterium]
MSTLYRKYRPEHWSDVAGQEHIVTTLTNALKGALLAHAYLFTGPRGTGKTTVARLLAKSINCTNRRDGKEPCGECANCLAFADGRAFDIIEIDGASNNGVENIRELRETVKLPPTLGTKKVYIIDEVHMLSGGAWNALLKTLEEPPSHVIFILATTELHKIPATISSRCQRFDFSRFPTATIIEKLSRIALSEGVTVDVDALEMIALTAEGGMRDAESLLAQAIALEDKHITGSEAATILGITERKTVFDFVAAIGTRNLDTAIIIIESLAQKGVDFRSFAGTLTHFLREILFHKLGDTARETLTTPTSPEERAAFESLATQFSFAELARLTELIHHARTEIRHASLQQVPLEVATLAFLFPEDLTTPAPQSRQHPTPSTSPSTQIQITPATPKVAPPTSTPSSKQSTEKELPPHETPTNTPIQAPLHQDSAPKESSTTAEEHTETPTASPFTLATIQGKWPAFLEEIKRRNASLSLSLSGSTPTLSESGTISVTVRHTFHKERLEKPENRLTIEEAIATIFGKPARLTVNVVSEEPTPNDPLLDSALEMLGGKVVG